MSGIFGIFRRDGRPVTPESLEAMRRAMACWGPEGSEAVRAGETGLGQLLLYNTPESLHERLPRETGDGLLFTAGARIDNRDELFEALDVEPTERADLPDGTLILRAYRKWGSSCADRLLGDWAFAVWDPRRRRLFLARDHHGTTALYAYLTPRLFVFASSLDGLLALPEVPRRANRLSIVQVLTGWPGDGVATCYEEIERLPPGHTLTVTPETVEKHRYWRVEDTPEIRLGSDEEYLEAFLEHYTEAVRCRLRSHRGVGVALSGGLDSSSVAALAARELASRGLRLRAFSSVPSYGVEGLTAPSQFGDETPFIEATRRFIDNLDVTYIRAEGVGPLAAVERALDLHGQPGFAESSQFWIQTILATARDRGVGTLLTGQDGNATVSWRGPLGSRLLACLRERRWSDFRSALRDGARQRGLWATIRGQLVGPLVPSLRRWYRRRRAGRDPWVEYSAINPSLARSLDLTRLMAESGHDPTFAPPDDPREERSRYLLPGRSIVGALWHELGAAYGMEARDPTADKRLITYCFSVPQSQYARGGEDRLLLRQGFEGRLPHEVLWNQHCGHQAADIGRRVLEHRPDVEAALARLERAELARAYLDPPRMRRVYGALQTRIDHATTRETVAILLRALSVGLFLERFEAPEPATDSARTASR